MDSQSSTLSSTSTVPEDLLENQDYDFVREINVVEKIYFGNVEIFNLRETGPENDDEDDDLNYESDTQNEREDSETRQEDADERCKQENLTCGCERLYEKPCSSVVDREALIKYR
ncbi:hypothetical protein KUTeg_024136 [Tegillarca granosa]|uniref:Uncharacterized protein n=1 Tax=Tegillarca granosa TaxID=220873 RepID=A0ABQ9DXJ1_TEGGR|nr:hypothetical protein KUTeg_024136 [Tegillarca granosa]